MRVLNLMLVVFIAFVSGSAVLADNNNQSSGGSVSASSYFGVSGSDFGKQVTDNVVLTFTNNFGGVAGAGASVFVISAAAKAIKGR